MLAKLEPKVLEAFLAAIADIKSSAQLGVIERAIAAGRTEDALKAMHLSPQFFSPLKEVLRAIYLESGKNTLAGVPSLPDPSGVGKLVLRFDGRNPEAEAWMDEQSSLMIQELLEGQRESIRAVLQEGIEAGRNPKATALSIIGRINRATGMREGGLIGLTKHQGRYVSNDDPRYPPGARQQLSDPATMHGYLDRKLRDKRYDKMVRAAIAEKRNLTQNQIDTLTNRYSDRLLAYRGETIARTETLSALHHAQYNAMKQLIETGAVSSDQVFKTWSATMDIRTRDTHMGLNNQKVPFDQPFVSPTGALLRFPHDGGLGAGAEEIINCRCYMNIRIKYLPD